MELEFIGTGTSQGIPVIACSCEVCTSKDSKDNRLRTSVLLKTEEGNIVIDTGPDFRQQMLRADVQALEAVLYTHEHKDHIAGMDDVRAYNFKQKRDMDLYGSHNVKEALEREFYYAFLEEKYPGVPNVRFHKIDKAQFKIGDLEIIPILVWHYKLPVFGYRIKDLVYITDAKTIDEVEKEKIKGCKILVVNALRKEPHISHFNLQEALDLIEEIKPEKAYLTHISHLFGKHKDIQEELPANVFISYDGLKVNC